MIYQGHCSLREAGRALPATAVHVMAMPVHMVTVGIDAMTRAIIGGPSVGMMRIDIAAAVIVVAIPVSAMPLVAVAITVMTMMIPRLGLSRSKESGRRYHDSQKKCFHTRSF